MPYLSWQIVLLRLFKDISKDLKPFMVILTELGEELNTPLICSQLLICLLLFTPGILEHCAVGIVNAGRSSSLFHFSDSFLISLLHERLTELPVNRMVYQYCRDRVTFDDQYKFRHVLK
jgi:hypothetical protein